MHSKNIPLLFIVASLTSTSLGLDHLVVAARRSLGIILARQTDPSACTSLCSSIESTVTSCTTTSCICTSTNAASIQACINCSVGDDPSIGVVSSAQSLIDTFATACATVPGVPSLTINTNPATSQSTPNTATLPGGSATPINGTATAILPSATTAPSPTIVPIPVTTVSQIVIGPSSSTASSVTSTASIGGLPLKSNASANKIKNLHWTGALLGLAAGNLLVF